MFYSCQFARYLNQRNVEERTADDITVGLCLLQITVALLYEVSIAACQRLQGSELR